MVDVEGKPVYVMSRELTYRDVFEIINDRDQDENQWWRTSNGRQKQMEDNSKNLKDDHGWILEQWTAIELATQLAQSNANLPNEE